MKDLNRLLAVVLEKRKAADLLSEQLEAVKKEKSAAEIELMKILEESGLRTFRSSEFNVTAMMISKLKASILPEKKEEVFRWIDEDMGHGDMIKPGINNVALTSFLSELMKEGKEEIPKDLFNLHFVDTLSIKKA